MRSLTGIAVLAVASFAPTLAKAPTSPRVGSFAVAGATFETESTSDPAAPLERADRLSNGIEQTWTWPSKPSAIHDVVVRVAVSGAEYTHVDDRGVWFRTRVGPLCYGHGTLVDALGARTAIRATYAAGHIELEVPADSFERATYPLVLDPTIVAGRELEAPAAGDPMMVSKARVTWTGAHYLVVTAQDSFITAARVSATGTVLDAPARKLVDFGVRIIDFAVATIGTKTLVVAALAETAGARAVVVAGDGASAGAPFSLPASERTEHVSVSASSSRFLVVTERFTTNRSIFFTRIDGDGTLIDTASRAIPPPDGGADEAPAVASDGTDWLAVWKRYSLGTSIAAAAITRDGAVSAVTTTPDSSSYSGPPSVVFSRSVGEYRVAGEKLHRFTKAAAVIGSAIDLPAWTGILWDTPAATHFSWLSGTSVRDTPLGSDAVPISAGGNVIGSGATVSSGGSLSIGTASSDALVSVSGHVGRFTPTTGSPIGGSLTPALLATLPQSTPTIASDGTSYFAGWVEARKSGTLMRSARFGADGALLEPSRTIGSVDVSGLSRLVFNPSSGTYSFARPAESNVLVERFTPKGVSLGKTFVGGSMSYGSGIASTDGTTLVGFNNTLLRLDASGAYLGTRITVPRVEAIGGGGGKFLVSWAGLEGGVRAVRVTTAGVIEDTPPLTVASAYWAGSPSIAFTGTDFAVAYEAGGEIRLGRVGLDGRVAASFVVLGTGILPEVVASGARLLVTWHAGSLYSSGPVVGAVVPRDAAPSLTTSFEIVKQSSQDWPVRVAAATDGAFMVLYPVRDHTGSRRAHAATIRVGGDLGGACAVSDDCEVGTCIDGVCCDRACSGACEACDVAGRCGPVSGDPRGTRTCEGFSCSAGVCRTTCATTVDCAAGHACVDSRCVPSKLGDTCARDADCATGFCTDGVCCDSRCDEICEACDTPTARGTCGAITGQPHTGRPLCAGHQSNVCSQTVCDGTRRDVCASFVREEVVCRAATCNSNDGTLEARCNGTGACPEPVPCNVVEEGQGCGCRASSRGPRAASLLILLGIAVFARRRRQ